MIMNLVRPELLTINKYQVTATNNTVIKLNKNENPWAGVPVVSGINLNRYPEQEMLTLVKLIANYYGCAEKKVLLTRGSDEGIDLIIRLFCQPYKDSILIMPPTFAMYENYARINAVKVRELPLINGEIDLEQLVETVREKVIFICNPNNPTGNSVAVTVVSAICQLCPNSIVVVDEAYIDFSNATSAITLLNKYENLIVLRTLSKSFGLAGIRCGIIFSSRTICDLLTKISAPYLLDSLSIYTAMKCLEKSNLDKLNKRIAVIKKSRDELVMALANFKGLFSKIWPSETNFVLVESQQATELFEFCLSKRILLRIFPKDMFLKNSLRITIGTYIENYALLAVFEEYLSGIKP